MLLNLGTVATLSLGLFLAPTAAEAKVWEMTIKGSAWVYDLKGDKMQRDSQIDSEGGPTPVCAIPVIMDEGYYYMMPDSQLFVLRRDLQGSYREISNSKYESACAGLTTPDPADPD